jgi:hypothetical protein
MQVFNALLNFETWDGAKDAEAELRAAGYSTRIYTDEIDDYTNSVWLDVWRSSEVDLWKQLRAIIDPLGGNVQEAILEQRRFGKTASWPTRKRDTRCRPWGRMTILSCTRKQNGDQ